MTAHINQETHSTTIVIHKYAKQLSRHFGTPEIANKEVISVQQGNITLIVAVLLFGI